MRLFYKNGQKFINFIFKKQYSQLGSLLALLTKTAYVPKDVSGKRTSGFENTFYDNGEWRIKYPYTNKVQKSQKRVKFLCK